MRKSQSLLDDIINSINILAERALNSVEQGLLNAPPATLGFRPPTHKPTGPEPSTTEEAARHEIENGTHQLETLLCASIDRNFDKFELYAMRNILCVRPEDRDWIRLSHYEGLDFAAVQNNKLDPDAPTVESVNALRRRLQASQKLSCLLHAEKARNDALLGELRAVVSRPVELTMKADPEGAVHVPAPFGFLHDKGDLTEGDAETPLATTTAFALSQMQALRALSTSLRNLMPDLGADGDEQAEPDGKKGWRRERLEYVETAARKHLENVRGLELSETGEVRDGEWQGEGRKLLGGEVESLEKVVTILGRAGAPLARDDEMDET